MVFQTPAQARLLVKIKVKLMTAGDAPLHIVGWSTAELWGPALPKYEHEEEPRTLQHTALLICSGLPYLLLFTFPHYLAVPTQSDNPHTQLSLHLALPSTPQPSKNRARPQIWVQQCFQITVTGIRYKDKSKNKRKKNLCGASFCTPGHSRSDILT